MPLGVAILNHAGGSTSSYSGVIVYHAGGVIVYHAGGSALSCRGVLLFSIMPAVYIIMPRVHGSGSRSYCLSFRAVLNHHAARVIVYHAGGSTLSFRGSYCLSGSGVIVNHAAVL